MVWNYIQMIIFCLISFAIGYVAGDMIIKVDNQDDYVSIREIIVALFYGYTFLPFWRTWINGS